MNPRILIYFTSTREHAITGELFFKNVLKPLNADLALCVNDQEDDTNIFYKHAKYIWKAKQPENFEAEFDKIAGNTH